LPSVKNLAEKGEWAVPTSVPIERKIVPFRWKSGAEFAVVVAEQQARSVEGAHVAGFTFGATHGRFSLVSGRSHAEKKKGAAIGATASEGKAISSVCEFPPEDERKIMAHIRSDRKELSKPDRNVPALSSSKAHRFSWGRLIGVLILGLVRLYHSGRSAKGPEHPGRVAVGKLFMAGAGRNS